MARISNKPPRDGYIYIEVLGNGKYEAVGVGHTVVGGVWLGMGTTRKQFTVPIDALKAAIADYESVARQEATHGRDAEDAI